MTHQPSLLMLFVLGACAEQYGAPVLPVIPPQFLAQVDQPVLQGDTAGEVAVLIVGLSGALGQANAQLSAIACLYLKHTPDTLFYLDPPYWGGENDYGKLMFERSDFQKMADMLRDLQGRFILSINDVPEIREIFEGFHFDEVKLNYSISSGAGKEARELIVTDVKASVDLFS